MRKKKNRNRGLLYLDEEERESDLYAFEDMLAR